MGTAHPDPHMDPPLGTLIPGKTAMPDSNYPRPQFVRSEWKSLDGSWSYSFDDSDDPLKVPWQGWIEVPYPPESPHSGVNDPGFHPVTWYQTRFEIPHSWVDQKILIHFGAVDYNAMVWINGRYVASHEGGHTPFAVDITNVLVDGEQILTVKAEDDPLDMEKPRGKQDWEKDPHLNWYPRTSGIWQPVWLEPVAETRIARFQATPDVPEFSFGIDIEITEPQENLVVDFTLGLGNHKIIEDSWNVIGTNVRRTVSLPDPGADSARRGFLWRPEHPTLFEIQLTLRNDDTVLDAIESYTALRSIEAHNGAIYLNGRPYFLQMVLDQGYWPESHLAAPSPEALKREVELIKKLGFNGVRKYQKAEDPRYFYWADKLGLLVWNEMPSFHRFTQRAASRLVRELLEVLERDYNHPSIIAWVPFNSSWGVSDLQRSPHKQHFVQSVYHMVKSMDSTRLVIDNDGWEHFTTDVVTIHDYLNDPELFTRRYGNKEQLNKTLSRRPLGRDLSLNGRLESDLPIILSEFGGIRFGGGEGWGYGEVDSPEEFLSRLTELVESVSRSALAGFCYTQLSDTFQEKTGLLTSERKPKVEPDAIASLLKACVKYRTSAD